MRACFFNNLPTDAAAETAPDSQEAADDAETQPQGKPERRVVETLTAAKPWNILEMVEKGFEIPIVVLNSFSEPDRGKFNRLGWTSW